MVLNQAIFTLVLLVLVYNCPTHYQLLVHHILCFAHRPEWFFNDEGTDRQVTSTKY